MLGNYAARVAGRQVDGSADDFAAMTDRGSVSRWAERSLGRAYRNRIISGTADGRINPQGGATRAQAAKMMVGLYDLVS